MNYSELSPAVKAFFVKEYSENAKELRRKAANPRARNADEYSEQALNLENIVSELKSA